MPEALGDAGHLLADAGYFSADNAKACEKAGVEPVIAMGRQPHHPPLSERFASTEDAGGPSAPRLAQADPEQVFGIIKSVLGFRQFSLRGLDNARGEWSLITMSWNLNRMSALAANYRIV